MSQKIYITQTDKIKLQEIIDKAAYKDNRTDNNLKALAAEINKAKVIEQEMCDFVFIKMNSKVILTVNQDEEELILVYPEDSDIKNNKISVLSPIGTAILGYCEGNDIEWSVPSGLVHIRIQSITD